MAVGVCSFRRAEAACNELYEPFKGGTKRFPYGVKMHEELVVFPTRWLKRCPTTEGREMFRAVPLWKSLPQ